MFEGKVFPLSVQKYNDGKIFMGKIGNERVLVVEAADNLFDGTIISGNDSSYKQCPLSHENAVALRKAFPFTAPVSVLKNKKTIGLGDRLGLAAPGHIKLIKDNPEYTPILAQQSMRELNLTGRTYENVLDDVTFAVFQEGYTGGFGSDGDHLKTAEDIKYALNCGYTMITLDCSDHIDNDGGTIQNIYGAAIDHAEDIFHNVIKTCGREVDFELSIDETSFTTSPEAHRYVAEELIKRGVKMATIAPRFCGEFQKGIDYIGDIAQFEKEFSEHAKIARELGHKISVHSGSDKFAVFSIIGKETAGVFHVKTAGTNWLEAVRVIAAKEPSLYRKMHKCALSVLDEAKKYYVIGARVENIADIDTLSDEQLPTYLDKDDSRQVLHITYGLILDEMRAEIFEVLNKYENEYAENLKKHIGKHLELLG